jgi:DNA polymerase III delta prime subunit
MREEAFKAWLEAGSARTEAGRNTRAYAVRTIENNLAALGSPHPDLDAAWEADRFEQLRQRLKNLREQFVAGGSDFRILMPESDKPYNRLSSWQSWLGQYAQFLSGEPRGTRDADRIRQHVLEQCIETARERDADTVDVLVRDVNKALGLNEAWPNICQAITGKKFLEMADVGPPEQIGADQSSATVFRFRLGEAASADAGGPRPFLLFDSDGEAFRPVQHQNRQTGRSAYRVKPPGASNKADDAIEVDSLVEVARAMLVEGRPARVQSIRGGTVNYLAYGKQKLLRYELDPIIAKEIGVPPRGEVAQMTTLDPGALERLRKLFLESHQDFRTFADSGSFGPVEDEYKRALIQRARVLMREHVEADDGILGAALLDLISGRAGLKSNLLGWRMVADLAKLRLAHGGEIEAAAGRLARHADPTVGSTSFVATCWPLLKDGREKSLPYGDSRTIPTMLRALVDPEGIMGIRSMPTENASMILRGHRAFTEQQLTSDQLDGVMAMAREIFAVMRDKWHWAPRDFWDVQGFIWETCQQRPSASVERREAQNEAEQNMAQPTNLILYGPPGTGKTYATAAEAIRLCGEPVPEDREELMAAYRRLSDAGRIEFVTFHQSISYEDFVEGLRPTQAGEDGTAGFELKPEQGVFRRIARRAETSTGPGDAAFSLSGRQVFKMSIGEAANPDDAYLFEEAVAGGYTMLGFDDIDWSDARFADRNAVIEAIQAQDKDAGALTARSGRVQMPFIFRNWVKLGDIVVVSKGNSLFRAIGEVTGDYQFNPREGGDYGHRRAVRWLWADRAGVPVNEIYARNFTMKSIYLLTDADLNMPALERYIASQQHAGTGAPEQFVLIIDEINRANISKVFGELITLLEPDKRTNQANALKVRLPYSGDVFGVPANLHIVGTMNTADRSIALLDTALRRRFDFRELMPNPSLLGVVEGVDLAKLLATINERIEYLFDREHQIGHAYFIRCETRADIDEVMRHRVIPLLAEYFYEDWTKVAGVLGDGDDGEGAREGSFIDRRRLQAPQGMGGDIDAAPRYRWKVRDAFSYDGFSAG